VMQACLGRLCINISASPPAFSQKQCALRLHLLACALCAGWPRQAGARKAEWPHGLPMQPPFLLFYLLTPCSSIRNKLCYTVYEA
jgi:hypothetical protein